MNIYKGVTKSIKPKQIQRPKTFNWGKVFRWYQTVNGITSVPPVGYMPFFSAHKEADTKVDHPGTSARDMMFDGINSRINLGNTDWYLPKLPNLIAAGATELQAICINTLVPYDKLIDDAEATEQIHGSVLYGLYNMARMYQNYRVTSVDLCCKPFVLGAGSDYIPLIRFGVLILDTNDTQYHGFKTADLITTIEQRRDTGTLKTVPVRGGRDARYSNFKVKLNIMEWCANRVIHLQTTATPPDPDSGLDTLDTKNYTGGLTDPGVVAADAFQANLALAQYQPNIKVWVLPFYWMERPDSLTTAGETAEVRLINEFELIQHVQFTNPRRGFFKDTPYVSA